MQILRQAKANKPIDINIARVIFTILQIEIMVLFCSNPSMVILENTFDFAADNLGLQSIVILIFALNLVGILYFLFKFFVSKKSKNSSHQKSTFLSLIEIKPYLFFVQILNFNIKGIQTTGNNFILSAAILNIIFLVLQVILLQTINISYRFVEKNYIRKKNNSILPWILIIPIISTLQFYGSIYGSVFLLIRAFTQLYFNFNNLENGQIRFSQWFFPLASIQLTFLIFVDFYLNLSIFSNVIVLTFNIIFTTYCCNVLSSHFLIRVLKYHLESCQHIMDSENQDNTVNGGQTQINESEMEKTLLQLRIMSKIHLSRLKHDVFEENEESQTENFDNWWGFYNWFILDHKVYCQNITCQCSKLEFMKQTQNHEIEKRIFADKIYGVIKKLQVSSSVSVNKLKIIENYFLIEMEKKPLKTYYQLMKIEREKLNREETLEIQNLILETRDNFKQLFLKQKVRNNELDIEPLFQFQDHLKNMRSQLNEMAVVYRHFYDIFANNFVQMQTLKQKTKLLTEFKKNFSHEIDFCLKKFDKSLELMTFCIVYFRFFDEYTNKLQKVEEKAQFLREGFRNPLATTKKESVDIFDPHYGAVEIDLVFKIGKIVTITKNLCHTLGFTHQQLAGQKVNKLMPTMFARNHDKFLRSFVEKGSLKMLKFKERVYYAKHMNKFLFPITMRLKVDYSHFDGFYSVSFVKPTQTKSEFMLINNYGKIEEITGGLYKRLFEKALGDDVVKVKRLCASKLILSLNYLFKDSSENMNQANEVKDGIIMTSQEESTLMSFYNFPELMKVYRGRTDKGSESNRSNSSASITHSNGETTHSLDLSEDMSKYHVDLKESIRSYFKTVDLSTLHGFRISYRFQTYVTNEFKCKILQIVCFREEIPDQQLGKNLSQQIFDVGEYMGIPRQQIEEFPIIKNSNASKGNSTKSLKNTTDCNQEDEELKSEPQKPEQNLDHLHIDGGQSDLSLRPEVEDKKKKQMMISAFQQETNVSVKLQFALTVLILMMASILIAVIVFSLQLQGNYTKLQQDNMLITNFRMDFFLRLTIQQLYHLYTVYDLPSPAYLNQKKVLIANQMKTLLQNSITWIGISWDEYQQIETMVDINTGFTQTQTIFATMQIIYETFRMAPPTGHYIIDNYVVLNANFLAITNAQFPLILSQSVFYKLQTHIVIGAYAFILLSLLAVLIWIRKLALEREDKIIDFLPFLKAYQAKRNASFYERFFEYNKNIEDLVVAQIQEFSLNDSNPTGILVPSQSLESSLKKQFNHSLQENNDSRLIRVIKNQKSGITPKMVLFFIVVSALCLFVIFYTEFFINQADNKFSTYIQLKSISNLVQLIPTRVILIYFINFNCILNNQPQAVMPQSFIENVFNKTFDFQTNISSSAYYGTQLQQLVRRQFSKNICDLISCSDESINNSVVQNQQIFYLSYRYEAAFDYLRKISKMLPNDKNPKGTMLKWIQENNVLEMLNSIQYVLDLMETTENEISSLFTSQIVQIGYVLLSLSLTLIPTLIVVMMFGKRKFMEYVIQRLECTENIYKHISWPMLNQNTYAANYFQKKLRNSKTY